VKPAPLAGADVASGAEFEDIQGLVRYGYKHHTEASFLLLRVKNQEAARAWLAAAPVASAVAVDPVAETVLQLALSAEGLRALAVPEDIVAAFAHDFLQGLGGDPSRARRLGDVGPNDPALWQWGLGERLPHLLLMLYALPGRLAAFEQRVQAQCGAGFELLAALPTTDMQGREPFGFVDGISQPQLDWEGRRAAQDQEQQAYVTLSSLGEILLGYPNEYGGYTDRPLLAPQRPGADQLPRAADDPGRADLGRNGSYLVLRQLQQDVAGFWQFVDRQAGGDAVRREELAARMVGRGRDGEPLVQSGAGAAATDLNDFDYREDRRGLRCPLGAHVRRVNPRNADLPPGAPGLLSWLMRTLGLDAQARQADLVASTRFHRLLRRGREYGAALSPGQALAAAPGAVEAGLHFICLGANIARQFEFVQSAWVAGLHFDGLRQEADPLLGARQPARDGSPGDEYSLPQAEGPDRRLSGLPPFVSVRGGAYFFLPGLRALRFLAAAR
jgi:deferrochelatase/peroxidase EfeB